MKCRPRIWIEEDAGWYGSKLGGSGRSEVSVAMLSNIQLTKQIYCSVMSGSETPTKFRKSWIRRRVAGVFTDVAPHGSIQICIAAIDPR